MVVDEHITKGVSHGEKILRGEEVWNEKNVGSGGEVRSGEGVWNGEEIGDGEEVGMNRGYQPDIDGVLERVDSFFAPFEPYSKGRLLQLMWPWMLIAALTGVSFELAKFVILESRRHLYNRNRKRAYRHARDLAGAQAGRTSKFPRKNQLWRTKSLNSAKPQGRERRKALLPVPPLFVEGLRNQWEKVHDSSGEMLRFGEMLVELDDYVDNSFVFKGDSIVSRKPGIKGFLQEHCPHIGYKTAMRYRTLALKAKEVETREKLAEFCKKCDSAQALARRLDSHLGVEHRRLRYRRRRKHRNASANSQSSLATLRDQARLVLGQLAPAQRKAYVGSLQKLVYELAGP